MALWSCRYSEGCNGGDVIDVIRYMKHFGVPDESCQVYAASDYTKYGKKAKECPAEGYCMNCMPLKVGLGLRWGPRVLLQCQLSEMCMFDDSRRTLGSQEP